LPGPKLNATFKDRGIDATLSPARVPDSIIDASLKAVQAIRFDERLAARFLGLWLTEPSPAAEFQPSSCDVDLLDEVPTLGSLKLDRATRIMYRGKELYINGELAPLPASPLLCELA